MEFHSILSTMEPHLETWSLLSHLVSAFRIDTHYFLSTLVLGLHMRMFTVLHANENFPIPLKLSTIIAHARPKGAIDKH